jgi:hypothetical protein
MNGADLDRLENFAEGLALAFYVVMFTALVMILAGSTGSGFLMLILGSCAHVGRAASEEFVAEQRAGGQRAKPASRPRAEAEREMERTRSARRTAA